MRNKIIAGTLFTILLIALALARKPSENYQPSTTVAAAPIATVDVNEVAFVDIVQLSDPAADPDTAIADGRAVCYQAEQGVPVVDITSLPLYLVGAAIQAFCPEYL